MVAADTLPRIADPLAWLDAPCVMGILNVTHDSYSHAGRHADPEGALARLQESATDGAAICDVGGESTRPGATAVSEDEELRRLGPVLAAVRERGAPLPLSIDTSKAA